jgi:cytochrome b involved in lipid metabolism
MSDKKDNNQNNGQKKELIICAHGKKYNVTEFVKIHPAGERCIMNHIGKDCTVDYDFHSSHARKIWKRYLVEESDGKNCQIM